MRRNTVVSVGVMFAVYSVACILCAMYKSGGISLLLSATLAVLPMLIMSPILLLYAYYKRERVELIEGAVLGGSAGFLLSAINFFAMSFRGGYLRIFELIVLAALIVVSVSICVYSCRKGIMEKWPLFKRLVLMCIGPSKYGSIWN